MKKYLQIFFILLFAMFAGDAAYAQYCASNATTVSDEEIFNVSLSSVAGTLLNNSSTCATTGGAGSILKEYSTYTASVTPPVLTQNNTYTVSVQVGTCGSNFNNSVSVYIDYNGDGDLVDAGEQVYLSAGTTNGPHTETGTFTVPAGATVGTTRMRVISSEVAPGSIAPCGTYSYGETEDYSVSIIACATPTTQATNLTFSAVNCTQMTVNWTNGNGSRRLVKINTSNSFTNPADGTDPAANTVFGGSEQVVYNGVGNSVTVTGLTQGVTYWFRIYEVNCMTTNTKFNTATSTNNPLSQQSTPVPVAAGTITGSSTVAQQQNGIAYSVPAISGATSYGWSYSGTGFSIASGSGTNSITANFSSTATSGNLTVWGINSCGSGTASAVYPISVTLIYCPSNATTINDEEILNVKLTSISATILNNSSTCATTGGAGSILKEYSTYTASVTPPDLTQNNTYTVTVQVGTCGSNFNNSVAVYIDYNGDVDFLDAGEQIYLSAGTTNGPHTENGVFTIPGTAVGGITRMRVISSEVAPASIASCGTYSYGETEDYNVNIIACATPTTQASGINFSAVNCTQMTVNWTSGSGSRRVVKMNTSNSFTNPADGTDPTANSVYAGGEQVVYNGVSNNATVTGLTQGVTYWFRIYEVNCTNANTKFYTSTASSNPLSQQSTPVPVAAGSISGSSNVYQQQTGVAYSITALSGASSYGWSYSGSGLTISSGSTSNSMTADFAWNATSGNLTVWGINSCGNGTASVVFPITVALMYCPSNATTINDEEIYNVSLYSIAATILNNSSSCSTTGGTGSILKEYSTYTASVTAPDLTQNNTYTVSVQVGTCGSNFNNSVAVYIDYNGDVDFLDAGEQVYLSPGTTNGPHTETGTFTIPATATAGITRMRVISSEVAPASIASCGTYSYGETEDYNVNIIACAAPSTQASSITFSGVNCTQMTTNWTSGNGSRRVVKMNTSNSFTNPTDGTDPTANSVYGGGEQVVYNGVGNSVTVTGLTQGVTYWFRIYEVNCTNANTKFKTVTATNNPLSQQSTPVPVAAGAITGSSTVAQQQTGVTYSITALSGASSYGWSYSGTGLTITSGSTSNSMVASFAWNATSGNLTVWGINSCGNGTTSAAFPITVTLVYCPSNASTINDEEIYNVSLSSIAATILNNSSSCSTTGGAGSVLKEYSDYTSVVAATTITQNNTYTVSVQVGTCGSNFNNSVAVYIDWNGDVDFLDAGEQVYLSAGTTNGPHTETGTFTVPAGAAVGTTRMRVISSEVAPGSISSCGTYSYGETEDYNLNIISCASPTTQATNLTFSAVNCTQMTVNWTSGNGTRRVVKMNTTNSFTNPADGTDPTANTVYGGGEQVVYNGVGSSVSVTGLTQGVTYWFRVYEVNCMTTNTKFNVASATNNPLSQQSTPVPVAAGTISGTASVAQQQNGVAYSVPAISGATSYGWSYSGTGFSIATGSGTNSITANFSSSATSGNLTVYGINSCGNGTSSAVYPITVTLVYCPSNATTINDEEIYNVTLGTLNNSSTCSTTGGSGSILKEYSNYTSTVTPPTLTQNVSYSFFVQVGTCGSNFNNSVAIYIDYNQDTDFGDAGEQAYLSPGTTNGPHTESGTITIPATATVGTTRMRVICSETAPGSISPCGTYSYGETEDYNITIFSPCTQPLDPPNPVAASNPACVSTTLNTMTPPAGETYYWQGTTCGTSTASPTSSPYTVNASGTYYVRARVNATGCWSANCGNISVSVSSVVPATPFSPTPASNPACGFTTLNTITPPPGEIYYWQGTSCGTSTSNATSSTYTILSTGTYYVRSLSLAGCWSAGCGSVGVTINPGPTDPPNPTAASNPACGSTTLNTMTPPGGETYYWQGTSCGTNTANPTSSTYPITSNGTYFVRARNNASGCWSTGCGSVAVSVSSVPTTANAGPNQNICNVTSTTLAGNTPASGLGTWSVVTGSATITTPNSPTSGVTGLSVGAVTLQWTIANAPCASSSNNVLITVSSAAAATANAGPDQYLCTGVTSATAAASGAGSGAWTYISGPAGYNITTPSSLTTTFTSLTTGRYVFRWTVSNGCGTSYDDVIIVRQ